MEPKRTLTGQNNLQFPFLFFAGARHLCYRFPVTPFYPNNCFRMFLPFPWSPYRKPGANSGQILSELNLQSAILKFLVVAKTLKLLQAEPLDNQTLLALLFVIQIAAHWRDLGRTERSLEITADIRYVKSPGLCWDKCLCLLSSCSGLKKLPLLQRGIPDVRWTCYPHRS